MRTLAQPADHRHFTRFIALWGFTAALLILLGAAGCRSSASSAYSTPEQALPQTIVSGSIHVPEGTSPAIGRVVELVNIATRERHRASTGANGGFSFRVAPGEYRVELALREGEAVVRDPGVLRINRSQSEVDADIVLGSRGASRPRPPVYRTDDGLGSPVA